MIELLRCVVLFHLFSLSVLSYWFASAAQVKTGKYASRLGRIGFASAALQ
jgi:hypothetical protein